MMTQKFPKAVALEAGCDAYLLRPISMQTVPDVVSVTRKNHQPPK